MSADYFTYTVTVHRVRNQLIHVLGEVKSVELEVKRGGHGRCQFAGTRLGHVTLLPPDFLIHHVPKAPASCLQVPSHLGG